MSTGQVTGTWRNSKTITKGISSFSLKFEEDELILNITGTPEGFLPNTIGPITAEPHAANDQAKECIAFHAETSIGDLDYFFAGNVNKGLIIIATYVKNNGGDKSSFFVREFFYKLK